MILNQSLMFSLVLKVNALFDLKAVALFKYSLIYIQHHFNIFIYCYVCLKTQLYTSFQKRNIDIC
jgi:hypothetical protein